MTDFKHLGVSPPILRALDDMEFKSPTPIQSLAIPHILNKKDLIVVSKTGSGKTAVFGVPLLQLTDVNVREPQVLILTPTRELAVQVNGDLRSMAKYLSHKLTAVYGRHNIRTEIQALEKGVTVVTGTPGRVYDHIARKNLTVRNVRFLVLDEADRMLDMGFIDQVRKIIKALPKERVTLLFSATFPAEIRRLCQSYMNNPETLEIESETKTVDTIRQEYFRVEKNEKCIQLERLLKAIRPDSCIIFCNMRTSVDRVQRFLSKRGYSSQALHGDIPQGKRLKTMQQFKDGEFGILVATDVAARGIHIDDLSLVANYDVPHEKDSYVHRIGRTGRAGNGGHAISLVTGNDIISLYEIEEHIGAIISQSDLPTEQGLNEQSEKVREWVAASKLKNAVPPETSVTKRYNQPRNKRSQGQKQRTDNRAQGNRSRYNQNSKKPAVQIEKKPYRAQNPVKGTERLPRETTIQTEPKKTEQAIAQSQTTEKKPFFKRLLKRLGRK